MALEWFDGFDHYGSVVARLLDGVYAEYEGVVLSTLNPRTGTSHLRITGGANDAGVRRVLSTPSAGFGAAYAFSITSLPTDTSSFALVQARNASNVAIFTVTVGPTGDLYIRNGSRNGTPLEQYENPAVFANSYQHFEIKFDGGFQLWLNEVLLIDSIAVPTGITGGNTVTSVKIGNGGFPLTGASAIVWDVDDLICYNVAGVDNVGPVGDCKVYTRFPVADGAATGFDISVGLDGFAMLDNVPPQDGTEYLSADGTALPKRSSFTLADLPLEIVEVKGVLLATRMFKTDAGSAKVTAGLVSAAVEAVSPEHALGQSPVWYTDVFDLDPGTAGPWSLSTANDITVFVERTE